jgi:Ca2+-binding EF-hand superfamily protein
MQKKMFDRLDTDQNGTLDDNELQAGKPKTMTKDQASKLYDSLDTNKSGTITMDEFAAGTQSGPGMGLMSQLSTDALDVLLQLQQQGGGMPQASTGGGGDQPASDAAYDALDTNKDGVVSEEEFLAAHPEQLTDDEAGKLFQTVDTDKDGTVTEDQFKTITDATTPPRLMGPSFFGQDSQSGDDSSSFGGMASLFGNLSGGPNSAYQLFDLLENESVGTTTASAA